MATGPQRDAPLLVVMVTTGLPVDVEHSVDAMDPAGGASGGASDARRTVLAPAVCGPPIIREEVLWA